jgi:phosphoribosylanthranilate isomerase
MLSGGLDPRNVTQALAVTNAPGVDVSSGVERAPGEKDLDKIRDFIRAARGTEHGAKKLASLP